MFSSAFRTIYPDEFLCWPLDVNACLSLLNSFLQRQIFLNILLACFLIRFHWWGRSLGGDVFNLRSHRDCILFAEQTSPANVVKTSQYSEWYFLILTRYSGNVCEELLSTNSERTHRFFGTPSRVDSSVFPASFVPSCQSLRKMCTVSFLEGSK